MRRHVERIIVPAMYGVRDSSSLPLAELILLARVVVPTASTATSATVYGGLDSLLFAAQWWPSLRLTGQTAVSGASSASDALSSLGV